MAKYYVVWEGRDTGVFDNWEDAHEQVDGYPGAKFRAYDSREAAVAAYRGKPTEYMTFYRELALHLEAPQEAPAEPEVPRYIENAVAVDGGCIGNPGIMEYRGVYVATGQEMFHYGPVDGGTNNIAEFLAIVHALAMLDKMGRPDIPVYSDSVSGMSWVRRRAVRTTLQRTPQNEPLFEAMERALKWLFAHPQHNPVLKWHTEIWGEIPADFGRKSPKK